MAETLVALALASLAAWVVMLFGRGGFWRADQRLPASPGSLTAWPAVTAVVPARDEADVIGPSIISLLAQDYPGPFSVVLVDDRSTDGTGDAARAAAVTLGAAERLAVLRGEALPPGWTGKMWAVEQGVRAATAGGAAPFLLLTDADIRHEPLGLRRLVAKAEAERLDLVSLMVRLHCRSGWERLLIPAFVFFFQMLYPFALVNRPESRVAAAAGGCMLVRRLALERAGGIAAIREAIIDDCALARLLKTAPADAAGGGRIWLGLTAETTSLRPYDGLGGIWHMVARSAYTQLRHSPWLLAVTVLGLAIVFLAPPVVAVLGAFAALPGAFLPALAAWAIMACCYGPTLRLYRLSPLLAPTLPLSAALYTAMTIDSALRSWRGRGGAWKGRTYPNRSTMPHDQTGSA